MRASIIQIGNSKGIRLPKSIIDQYNIQGEIMIVTLKRNELPKMGEYKYYDFPEFKIIIGYQYIIPTKKQIFLMLREQIRYDDINKNIIDYI